MPRALALLTEFGEVIGTGRIALEKGIAAVLARLSDRLPMMLIDTLREQWGGIDDSDRQVAQIERRLHEWMKQDEAVKAIAANPGVGLLSATAAVVTMGDAKASSLAGSSRRGVATFPRKVVPGERWHCCA